MLRLYCNVLDVIRRGHVATYANKNAVRDADDTLFQVTLGEESFETYELGPRYNYCWASIAIGAVSVVATVSTVPFRSLARATWARLGRD